MADDTNKKDTPATGETEGATETPQVKPTPSSNEVVNTKDLEAITSDNSGFTDDKTAAKDIYSNLISMSYDNVAKKENGIQIVDILNDYRWTMQKFNNITDSSGDKEYRTYDVPFCYVTEWRQNISSGIMNLINSLNSTIVGIKSVASALSDQTLYQNINSIVYGLGQLFNSGDAAVDAVKGAQQSLSSAASKVKNWIPTNVKDAATNAASGVSNIYTNVKGKVNNPAKNSVFLKPYCLLYGMEETGKRYAFPMVNEPPKFNMGTNTFSDGNESASNIHKAMDMFSSFATQIPAFGRDFLEISNLLNPKSSSKVYHSISVEKAKYFSFPTNTNTYTVSFPLINTIGKDEWKKNYTFILLFILRNMIFRKDSTSYYPPLIYDLIIPGTIRQPYCYVQQVDVQPLGMIRALGWDASKFGQIVNGKSQSKMTVFVPQVWMVTITFTSLLAPSANMVISSLTDLPISTK